MNLRITSILILCVSACLVIPKIADARGTLSDLVANSLTHSDGNHVNSQELTDVYVPPNYGVPNSQHGSGTR
ncbi:hypothetical protein [Nostoc sp. PCC 7107]|uniref:hypothetical protein n=1 Tax=Nostoc sp. PCC 7107 TaxID=317936 RepID=UPI0006620BC0|nr:hypothetical protein [Nostoc sp. PCC 7107]